jgi:hypothetical protein
VIATDQALHFSILAVSFYGWRLAQPMIERS